MPGPVIAMTLNRLPIWKGSTSRRAPRNSAARCSSSAEFISWRRRCSRPSDKQELALRQRSPNVETGGVRGLGEFGEIDVGAQIGLSRRFERMAMPIRSKRRERPI